MFNRLFRKSEFNEARKIAFINCKGGVGKTSLVVNVGACLAHQGHRVLIVDLDAQSNASIWLMGPERWNLLNKSAEGSVFSLFNRSGCRLGDCIQKDVLMSRDGEKLLPGLDLAPATFQLIDLERGKGISPGKPAYLHFQEELNALDECYDFILFDCPPNVLQAAQCGLFASSEVYVPANADALSLVGFTFFVEKLLEFNIASAGFRQVGMGSAAEVQGIIFNGVKANVDITIPKIRMQCRLNQLRKQREVSPGARIFSTSCRDAVVVRRAVTLGLPLVLIPRIKLHDTVLEDYLELTQELSLQCQTSKATKVRPLC